MTPRSHVSLLRLRERLGPRVALAALMLYGWGVWLVPYVHLQHHERAGTDHEHTAEGTVYRPAGLAPATHAHGDGPAHQHEAARATGTADAAPVAEDAGGTPRPLHQKGALEHLWLLALFQDSFVFSAPVLPVAELVPVSTDTGFDHRPAAAPACRGPPAGLAASS